MAQAAEVHVAGAPAIPGLRFRHYAGPVDVAALAEIRTAAYLADALDEVSTPETVANELAHAEPERWVPERDLVVVELDGRVVGWSWRDIRVEPSGNRLLCHRGYLLPEARRRGIGTALLRHNEAALVARATADPTVRAAELDTWTAQGMAGAVALAEREGYRPARYFFTMVRPTLDDLPESPLPEGLEVRPVATPEDAERVLRAIDEIFAEHWGFVQPTAEDDRRWLDDPRQDMSLWQVAWDGNEIAGVVLPLVDTADNAAFGRRRGWLDAIGVRGPWRRRGVARALIATSLRALRDRGLDSAILDVDSENETGALGLYERSGFAVTSRVTIWRMEVDLAQSWWAGRLADKDPRRENANVLAPRLPLVAALAVALGAGACSAGGESPGASGPEGTMTATTLTLSSPAFADGGPIPRRHSCDGPDLSPPLAWTGAPGGAAAFALVVEDPDARGFVHWVVTEIGGDTTGLPEGVPAAGPPAQGRNDFGRIGWGGPCPPSGTHRYVFTLYALAKVPSLPSRPTAADVRRAIAGSILAEARLTGTYRR